MQEDLMARAAGFRTAFAAVVALMLVTLVVAPARAQAWLPAKGEGAVSVVYQDVFVQNHYLGTTLVDAGHIQTQTVLVDITYGVTDKLAVTFGIPWVASKYSGDKPHPIADLSGPVPTFSGVSPLDDGAYHQTLTDIRFDVRYNIAKKWIVLTPFIGSVTPSHDYMTFAHAAPGQNTDVLQVGVSAAKLLDGVVPGLFVQGRYAYGIAEKFIDISHNRSNVDLELGYFVTPKLRVLGLSTARVTHGGIDLPLNPFTLPPFELLYHDRIMREDFLNFGGGAAFALSENLDLFGSMLHTVVGRNGHPIDRGLSLGLSWSFSTARGKDRAIASAEHSLSKCMCEKRGM
jgi:hypothetical protein